MKLYYYLYFKLYKFAKSVGTVDATWTAMLLLTVLVYFNVMTVCFFLFGVDFLKLNLMIFGLGLGILIGIFNYVVFVIRDTCNIIINKFKNESKNQKYIGSLITLIYVVLTVYLAH